jgi:hypothetical protein
MLGPGLGLRLRLPAGTGLGSAFFFQQNDYLSKAYCDAMRLRLRCERENPKIHATLNTF